MNVLKHLFLSLLFSIPVWSLCLLVIVPLFYAYDYLYAIYLGPVLMLLSILWGIYGLIMPFLLFLKMQKQGPSKAWRDHVLAPLVHFFPITILVGFVGWVYFHLVFSPYEASHFEGSMPPMEFIKLLAFLLFVAEGFKISQRKWELEQYRNLAEGDSYQLRLSPRILNMLVYAQSLPYLFFFWAFLYVIFYLNSYWFSSLVPYQALMFLYISLLAVFIYFYRKMAKRIEDYGRMHAYIPWNSKY